MNTTWVNFEGVAWKCNVTIFANFIVISRLKISPTKLLTCSILFFCLALIGYGFKGTTYYPKMSVKVTRKDQCLHNKEAQFGIMTEIAKRLKNYTVNKVQRL